MAQFALFICFLIPERVVLSVPLILRLTQALLLKNPRDSYAQCKVHCTKYTAVLKLYYWQNGQISSTAKSQWQLFLLFFVWDCCWVFHVHVCVRACVCVLGGGGGVKKLLCCSCYCLAADFPFLTNNFVYLLVVVFLSTLILQTLTCHTYWDSKRKQILYRTYAPPQNIDVLAPTAVQLKTNVYSSEKTLTNVTCIRPLKHNSLTCSQCLLRIPGFRRPWISGMYGRKSSIIPLISDATSCTAENPDIWEKHLWQGLPETQMNECFIKHSVSAPPCPPHTLKQ